MTRTDWPGLAMRVLAATFSLALLSACTHLDERSPASVNFSGTWIIDPARSDTTAAPPHQSFDEEFDSDDDRVSRPAPGAVDRAARRGPAPRLPMLTAQRMTIEQDATSMGIDYPNQPYRDVNWGRHERGLFDIEAGWDEDALVVKTASAPLHIKEVYSLSDDRNTLTLRIELKGRAVPQTDLVRVFVRDSR